MLNEHRVTRSPMRPVDTLPFPKGPFDQAEQSSTSQKTALPVRGGVEHDGSRTPTNVLLQTLSASLCFARGIAESSSCLHA